MPDTNRDGPFAYSSHFSVNMYCNSKEKCKESVLRALRQGLWDLHHFLIRIPCARRVRDLLLEGGTEVWPEKDSSGRKCGGPYD